MNFGRYYMPNFGLRSGMTFMPMGRNMNSLTGFLNAIKRFNWKGLMNGANKTLNVINQTIPLVKEAGPAVGNIKSMVKMVRAFSKETNNKQIKKTDDNLPKVINNSYQEYPTFFVQ